ncbi:MAG TPA: AIM24 family protein [Pyrinomonadaceae bacterium]|jgi:uncharacterized protein (AIM24 family)
MSGYHGNPEHPSTPPHRTHTCAWCGKVSDGASLSCAACGATLDVKEISTRSGWSELPGRKDMAKLQFGNSFCQVEGMYVPVADFNLAPEDSVYFAHHVLLWKDPQVNITTMSLKGAWKRLLSGMPLVMTQAQGPGHIAFSRDAPGELIALPIQPGQAVDVREHIFMVATSHITYDWFQTGIWFRTSSGNESETHYPVGMFMDRFFAPQMPGLLLLHAAGNVFVRQLAPGQTILVKPTALLYKDPTVQMQLHIEKPSGTQRSWRTWGNRYLWLRLFGPGRVAVQSAFKHMEDNGRNISGHSGASTVSW